MQKKLPLLEARHIKTFFPVRSYFGHKSAFVKAVNDVSLSIYPGETVGLVGESGCGKSTLGRTLIGMIPASEGEILYRGEKLGSSQDVPRSQERQMIFQDP